jgi:hypothetical protein
VSICYGEKNNNNKNTTMMAQKEKLDTTYARDICSESESLNGGKKQYMLM